MPSYAYFHKQVVPLDEAKIGIMTHALHYGTACFEGIRGNWSEREKQIYLFRLREHYERLGIADRVELDLHEGGHEIRVETGIPFMEKWLVQ